MKKLITVIDDEPDILELVKHHVKKTGFQVEGFLDAESFIKFVNKKVPDLIILDLMLPDTDGLEVCKKIKGNNRLSSVPIIMLTAKAEETDKIIGLELGADDYVTKPFSPKELVARIKAVLRRQSTRMDTGFIKLGDIITIDLEKFEVLIKDKAVELTATEFKVLKLLGSRKGRVFTRDEILDFLWGNEKNVIDRTIDVHIRHLREKLGTASKIIKNVRGIGYKIDE